MRYGLRASFFIVVAPILGFGQVPGAARITSATAATPAAAASHILAPHDLIEVKVFGEPELDISARIPDDGRITVSLIGEVPVAGKSVQEATRLVRERLAARFLVNPQVSISVVEPAKRLFTVIGQVQRPGTYRFPDRQALDLMQVIGIAGGYTRIADPAKITVKRRDSVVHVNGKRLARDQNTDAFRIEGGDLITVGERLF